MMVLELEKLIEYVFYIPYNKENETFSLLLKAINSLQSVIERNHFLRTKIYLNDLNSIKSLFNDDLSKYLTGSEDKLIQKNLQKKLILLSRTILEENKKIFVVHGRNINMRDKLTSLLGRLKLDYVILENESNQGTTVIEKFQKNAVDCRFAIVLFSPDDIGKFNNDNETLKARTRQNVVLELGYFLGKIGRKNIIILHPTSVEIEKPSDFDGVVYEPFDEYGAWKTKVIKEMKNSGIYIDQTLAERA